MVRWGRSGPNPRDRLKDRALARGLVTTDYDLRQRDIVADALRAEGIDRIENPAAPRYTEPVEHRSGSFTARY
jgi:hypothetical protein